MHGVSYVGPGSVYNALIGTFRKAGKGSKAEILAAFMERNGCVPDVVTYNTLINYHSKEGHLNES